MRYIFYTVLCAMSCLLVGLHAQSKAIDLFTGESRGVFLEPIGEPDMEFSGEGRNTFSWGKPVNSALSTNSILFEGKEITATAGQTFTLGNLSYYNGDSVSGTNAKEVRLRITIDMHDAENATVDIPLLLISTKNRSSHHDNADIIEIGLENQKRTNVTINGQRYVLKLFFGKTSAQGFIRQNRFHVFEQFSAIVAIRARIINGGEPQGSEANPTNTDNAQSASASSSSGTGSSEQADKNASSVQESNDTVAVKKEGQDSENETSYGEYPSSRAPSLPASEKPVLPPQPQNNRNSADRANTTKSTDSSNRGQAAEASIPAPADADNSSLQSDPSSNTNGKRQQGGYNNSDSSAASGSSSSPNNNGAEMNSASDKETSASNATNQSSKLEMAEQNSENTTAQNKNQQKTSSIEDEGDVSFKQQESDPASQVTYMAAYDFSVKRAVEIRFYGDTGMWYQVQSSENGREWKDQSALVKGRGKREKVYFPVNAPQIQQYRVKAWQRQRK